MFILIKEDVTHWNGVAHKMFSVFGDEWRSMAQSNQQVLNTQTIFVSVINSLLVFVLPWDMLTEWKIDLILKLLYIGQHVPNNSGRMGDLCLTSVPGNKHILWALLASHVWNEPQKNSLFCGNMKVKPWTLLLLIVLSFSLVSLMLKIHLLLLLYL